MKRQIVQIAVTGSGYEATVFALCNDGTVWEVEGPKTWAQLAPIPQDPEAPEVAELRKFVEGNGEA